MLKVSLHHRILATIAMEIGYLPIKRLIKIKTNGPTSSKAYNNFLLILFTPKNTNIIGGGRTSPWPFPNPDCCSYFLLFLNCQYPAAAANINPATIA